MSKLTEDAKSFIIKVRQRGHSFIVHENNWIEIVPPPPFDITVQAMLPGMSDEVGWLLDGGF